MRQVDLPPSPRALAAAALGCLLLAGCHRGAPCGVTSPCAEPSVDSVRFVTLEALPALEARGQEEGEGLCFGPERGALELDFGRLPPRLVTAELRLIAAGPATATEAAVVTVRAGRRRVSAAYRAGTGRPVLVDVSELVEGGERPQLRVTATAPVCVAGPDAALEARPQLTLSRR